MRVKTIWHAPQAPNIAVCKTTTMHAQWAWLPLELQDRVLWDLNHVIVYPWDLNQVTMKCANLTNLTHLQAFSFNQFSNARLISKTFAAKLRRTFWLFCPGQVNPKFPICD